MLALSLEEMDSEAMERAISKTTPGHRQWVAQHITGHFSHGKNMVCSRQQLMAQSPQCQAEMEDKGHILRCLAPSAQRQRELTKLSRKTRNRPGY